MAIISLDGGPKDANDGRAVENPTRVGNLTYGQRVLVSGTERPIAISFPGEKFSPSLLASQGRVFYASDADQNDLLTGQTSFANTTPTLALDVPAGTTAIPLMMSLVQGGTVAGAVVTVVIEFDDTTRITSGTAETVFCSRPRAQQQQECTLRSTVTADAGYGVRVAGWQVGADVEPAEGAVQEILWTPTGSLDFLDGPASWLIYTYAGTTGPSWFWTLKWAEIPTAELG